MRFILATVLLFGAAISTSIPARALAAQTKTEFKKMDANELDKTMKKEKLFVFDSNSEEMFKSGHVPGAKHMPFPAVTATNLPAQKDAKLVFYCANERCTASHDTAKKAMELGYSDVWVMTSGIQGWQKAGKPVEK